MNINFIKLYILLYFFYIYIHINIIMDATNLTDTPATDTPATDTPAGKKKSTGRLSYIIFTCALLLIGFIYWIIKSVIDEAEKQKILEENYKKGFLSTANKKIYYKGDSNWKYTISEYDPDCLENWDFYDSDKKTLIKAKIPRTTTIYKNKKWCATKSINQQNTKDKTQSNTQVKTQPNTQAQKIPPKNIYYKYDDKWKYTNSEYDPDCLENWDFYDSDKKTLIKANISRTTTIDKKKRWCATKNSTLPIDRSDANIFEKNTDLIFDNVGGVARVAIVAGSRKLLSSAAGRTIKTKLLRVLKNNIIAKIGGKIQSKLIGSLAKNMSKNLGKRMALKLSGKIATQVGKMAGKVGITASTKATKFALLAAKIKPSPTMIFDILSMGLDMGDAGGYERLQTKGALYTLKAEVDKQLKQGFYESAKKQFEEIGETLTENDFIWPVVYDPLENEPDSFDSLVDQEVEKILQDENNILIKPVFDAIDADLESGKITQDQLDNDTDGTLFSSYLENLDIETISKKVYEDFCKSKGGIIYDGDKCTLPASTCNKWPLQKDKDGNIIEDYKEFKDGKCVYASSTLREKCEEMNLPYDINTGICTINENYCKSKAAEWRPNKNINNEYDCIIPIEQSVVEGIFGKTITRGLKQVFDPAQYEGCGFDGPIKVKNKCVTLPNKQTANGTKIEIYDCLNLESQDFYYNSIDNTVRPMLNYNKCLDLPNGSTESGTKLQLWDCNGSEAQKFLIPNPPGGTSIDSMISNAFGTNIRSKKNPNKCVQLSNSNNNNGNTLELVDCLDEPSKRLSDITADNNKDCQYWATTGECVKNAPYMTANCATSCNAIKQQNLDNAGQIFNLSRIELRDDGLICNFDRISTSDCPTGYTNVGVGCQRSTPAGDNRVADCPPGYTNNGATCGRGADSRSSDAGNGAYVVASCPVGSTNYATVCNKTFARDGFFGVGVSTATDLQNCEKKYGVGNCTGPPHTTRYPKCNIEAAYLGLGSPEEYVNTGAFCQMSSDLSRVATCPTNYPNLRGAFCYIDCEKKYGPGYYNNGTSCWRDVDTKGMDSMTCNSDEFRTLGRCYKNCPEGGTNTGAGTCTLGESQMKCKDYETKGTLGTCTKACPPGYTNTGLNCTRTKNRKIDYSTQKN